MNRFIALTILGLACLVGWAMAGPDVQAYESYGCSGGYGCSMAADYGCSSAAASCSGSVLGVRDRIAERRANRIARRQGRRAALFGAGCSGPSYGCAGGPVGCGG